ncbi:MAG TPA: ATP-binding protein [Candidatus Limnocylindrales bacterium]|nr:ATP-binding protein [Candidatus Limnocylindrales bacterium]
MSPVTPPNRPDHKRSRTPAIVGLSIAVFLLFAIIFSQATFNLTFLQPDTSEETLIFAALSALIFLLFVALTFVLLRILLRLYAERKTGVMGSKLRSRMVMGALLLSLGPVIFLFLFSYGLINRSIEKWFSRPVEDVQYRTGVVAALLTDYAADNARVEAERIASSPAAKKSFETDNFTLVMEEFRRSEVSLQGGFAFAVANDRAEASFHAPQPWPLLHDRLPMKESAENKPKSFDILGKTYVLGRAVVGPGAQILVAMPLPANYSLALRDIEQAQQQYQELRKQRRRLRRTYLGYILMLTVGTLFASTWLALYLSKMVTRPLVALAEATQEISRGHLDYRVDVQVGSEIGQLVNSFNQMAADLEASRASIEASRADLADVNVQIEQRNRHIETILESIPTGVLSLDASRHVVHMNGAVERLLHLDPSPAQAARTLEELLPDDVTEDLEHLMRKADRMGTTTSQMEIVTSRVNLNVAVTVASLDSPARVQEPLAQRMGYVVVLEDMTDLLRAQKQTAWSEVARRVAHEIKNPLTPIALSAERIRRHLERGAPPDAASLKIIRNCVDTIGSSVQTVRTLVDEFATLARFPASRPMPSDINSIVESALLMFDGRLSGIRVQKILASGLPPVHADPDAIKRAIANLVDNAAEAMQGSMVKEIVISTALAEERDSVEIVLSDTGHGVTPALKEKLFLPYFSTKKRGTGLGLAIVSRIVEDHHGSIRVEENTPIGTRFIVELPVASAMAVEPSEQHAHHSDRG